MKVNDKSLLKGHLKVETLDRSGQKITWYDDHNLVVDGGCQVVAELLGLYSGAEAQAYNQIATINLSGRTTGSSDTSGNTPPAPSQVALQGIVSIAQIPITSVSAISSPIGVLFQATLDFADGNGNDVQDAGLFTMGGPSSSPVPRMFARQSVGIIPKTSAISVLFSWAVTLASS